jgi:uncharacterized protein YjbI with pentapeptide repeats
MTEESKSKRLREKISRRIRIIVKFLDSLKTRGIAWFHRGATRLRHWIRTQTITLQHIFAFLRHHSLPLGTIVALTAVIFALWMIPQWQVPIPEDPKLLFENRIKLIELRDKARGTLAQIIGGLIVLGGLYFTWRRIEVAQEGQITERFTRAIDHLGNRKLEIRLGGIYALERIARDSAKDHWQVTEVLTAFVREHSPWLKNQPPKAVETPVDHQPSPEEESNFFEDFSEDTYPPMPLLSPSLAVDIQAILTVLGRRLQIYGKGEHFPLDMRRTDLRRANLAGAHLEGVILSAAHLDEANLADAHLKKATLMYTSLVRANLNSAYLEEALLVEADLKDANLIGAHLEGAVLHRARLEGTSLWDTHLEGAQLTSVVGLTRAQLESACIDERTQLPDYLKTPVGPATEG